LRRRQLSPQFVHRHEPPRKSMRLIVLERCRPFCATGIVLDDLSPGCAHHSEQKVYGTLFPLVF